MLTIHHLEKSCSERIIWLAEELGIAYKLVVHRRDPHTARAPARIYELSPFGKAPVIEHEGKIIAESAAIIEYILDRFDTGRFRPKPGTDEHLDYRFWMHASEATMKPPLIVETLTSLTQCAMTPALKEFVYQEYATTYEYLNKVLSRRDYVAGTFSGADLMVWYELRIAGNANLPDTIRTTAPIANYPRIVSYISRLESRPAYRKAAAQCGSPALCLPSAPDR